MEKRPVIKLELTLIDKIFEILSIVTLLSLIVFSVSSYLKFPDIIPTHFNFKGQVDGFGSKGTIFILPVIGLILYIALTYLNKFPHIFNYSIEISSENAHRQYMNATRMLRCLKFTTILIFHLIVYEVVLFADRKTLDLGIPSIVLMLGLVFIPIIYYIVKANKLK